VTSGNWSQAVSCSDVAGRPREVKILVDNAELFVIAPPGEVMRLTVDESMFLRAALEDAENEWRRQCSR
jgi:hypothetical protein